MIRQKVTRNIRGLDLDGPVDVVIKELTAKKEEALADGWSNLYVDIDNWNDGVDINLKGDRDETDQEMEFRVNNERRRQEEKDEKDRKEYERLARKFGNI